MSETSTAMRDPVFYRWHKYIDDVFQEYKLMQPPYTLQQVRMHAAYTEIGIVVVLLARKISDGYAGIFILIAQFT